MIPQIIKKIIHNTTFAKQGHVRQKSSSTQTTKQLSFSGVGNLLETIGQKTCLFLNKVPGLQRFHEFSIVHRMLKAIGLEKRPAPWEIQFVGQPKATWGALSSAVLQQKLREKNQKPLNQEEHINHLWGKVHVPSDSLSHGQDHSNNDNAKKSQRSTTKCKGGKRVVKMTASKKGSSNTKKTNLPEKKSVFVATHTAIDTPAKLNKEIVIIGQKVDKERAEKNLKGVFSHCFKPNTRKEGERGGVRGYSACTVGVFAGLFLFLSSIWSFYDKLPETKAEIWVQSYAKKESKIASGMQIYSYEDRSEFIVTSQTQFIAGSLSTDQFQIGSDDLIATTSNDLTLEHYGETPPDLTQTDWWDDDNDPATLYNWRYRRCFDVDNTASGDDMIQHQIYIDTDIQTLIVQGKMQSEGQDIRFTNNTGDLLPHYIADDIDTAATKLWVQIDNLPAGQMHEICMYYGNPTASDTGSRRDVFTYDNPQSLYFVTQDTADGSVAEFVSYTDNNDIAVSAYSQTLSEADFDIYPSASTSLSEISSVSVTDPINASYQANGTDNLVPVSAAGTQFVYRTDRYTNEFSIISPWCNASLTFENESGNNILDTTSITTSPFSVAAGGSLTITTNDTTINGLTNNAVVIIEEVGDDCPVLISHHATTGGDSYTMFPAQQEWYGVGSGSFNVGVLSDTTNVTVFKSDGTTVGPTLYNRGDGFAINDAGSQGSEVAHRVVADKPIGVQARGDGDGGDAVTFLPEAELGYRYYIADVSQYIAIATTADTTTSVDLYHDGTTCGIGAPDSTVTVVANGDFPGKAYFGSTTNGDNIPSGACVVASNPIYAYNEFNTQSDEHNLWNEKQNRQIVSPQPTYTVGAQETGMWSIDTTNNWIYRLPVTVTNNATTAIDQYQVLIDLGADVATMFGKTQTDGGDIRVAGAIGDGTDDLTFALESFDATAATGKLWVKTPTISAAGSTIIYLYYSPIGIDVSSLGPLLWADAADTSSITHTAGSVNTWNDKSGNANHLTQTNTADQPTLLVDGTKQVVSFNGSHMLDASGIWGNLTHSDTYVFSAYKNLALPENGILFGERISGGRYEAGAPENTDVFYQPNRNSQGSISGPYNGSTTDYNTMRFEAHAGGTRIVTRDNTTILASDNGGNTFTGQSRVFSLGGRENGSLEQTFNLGEMIIFSGLLTATQVSEIENYLSQKWVTGPTTTLTTTGDYEAIWSTTTPKPNYYIVDARSAAVGVAQLISSTDGNTVIVDGVSQNVQEGEIVTIPASLGVESHDIFTATGPLAIGFDADTTDSALPIGYAGKEFVMMVGRNSDSFSFFAPFENASVQIQQSTATGYNTVQTVTVNTSSVLTLNQDIANNSAFRVISDEPILAFHRNSTFDSKLLYPVDQAKVQSSGKYEIYGVGSGSINLASTQTTDVEIYRSDGTSSTVTLDGSNLFSYTESGAGAQGTAFGYRLVSDDPIGASSYADSDGGETASFVSQKEFSSHYILSHDTQYMSIVTRHDDVECRVYDQAGTAVTTGPVTMDNIPPQTGGSLNLPYVNRIHIGGDDNVDPAYFTAGYSLECDHPVYAYYEHHLNTTITDETSWLSWPQARKRNHVEPDVQDIDAVQEQGLYYESGFDSSTPEATAVYTIDLSSEVNGQYTTWQEIIWDETISNRGALNSVQQVKVESAHTNSPNCETATYSSYEQPTDTTILSSTTDTSPLYYDSITNAKRAIIAAGTNDHNCLRVRLTLASGDPVLSPTISEFRVGYLVPDLLEGQRVNPQIDVKNTAGTTNQKSRIAKVITNDPGLLNSQLNLTFRSVSDATPFVTADFELQELQSLAINPQFTFPPFPLTPLDAATMSPLDASNQVDIYYTGQRTPGSNQQINMTLNLDIAGAGGPQITRDFILEVEG